MIDQHPLATPEGAKVLARQRSRLSPDTALKICMADDLVNYHTYDLMRASGYLADLVRQVDKELRRRYEVGTL